MKSQTITGWRTILKANNQVIAAGFVLDYLIDTDVVTVQGVDDVLPTELAPNTIAVSMNIKVYRTPKNDPITLGIAAPSDTTTAQSDMTRMSYITVEVRDKVTDKTVLYLPRAWITKRSGGTEAEGMLTETWSIKSIGYYGPGQQVSSIFGVISNLGS